MPSTVALVGGGVALLIILIIIFVLMMPTSVDQKFGLTAQNSVKSGGGLPPTASISNGSAFLGMQGDGNLVLYKNHNTTPVAVQATMTSGNNNSMTLDDSGLVKVIGGGGSVLWTGPVVSGGKGVWHLKVNPDATVTIINPAGVGTPYVIGRTL